MVSRETQPWVRKIALTAAPAARTRPIAAQQATTSSSGCGARIRIERPKSRLKGCERWVAMERLVRREPAASNLGGEFRRRRGGRRLPPERVEVLLQHLAP